MKKLLLVLLLGSCVSAFGQGARFGDANPTQTSTIIPGNSGLMVKVIPSATINFCSWPANAVPCTNKATTYTDYTLSTPCATSTQVVLSGTTNCVGTADSNGNWGVWVAPGLYQYTFTYQGNNYGPFFAVPTGNGTFSLNCPNAASAAPGTGVVGAMTSQTGFNCDPNFVTDLAGNFSAQSGKFLGPVNGFFGVIGGTSDPGTQAKFKLGTNEVRMLAPLTAPTPYYWRIPGTRCAVGQGWQLTGETTDANGDKVDAYGCATFLFNPTVSQDFTAAAAPAHPVSGNLRLYADSNSGTLKCLNSSGGGCLGVTGVPVSAFAGADLGAQINNCDTYLGSNPGTCFIDTSGTISTPVVIGAAGNNHVLYGMSGITVAENPALTQPLSIAVGCDGCVITGAGKSFTISATNTLYNGATFTGDLITVGTHTSGWNSTVNTTITSDVAINDTTITVTSTTGMAAGQDVLLKENLDAGSHVGKWAEYNVVSSVTDATHVVLKYGTEHVYRAAFSPSFATFATGTLTKHWEVSNLHLTGGTCAPAATGSNSGVGSYVALGGSVHDVWVDCVGGRGVLVGSSGYPASHVTVENNHIHDVGYVPLTGSMGIEDYSQSSHVIIKGNDVWRIGAHGIVSHGMNNVIDGNNVSYSGLGPGSVGSCFSSDTADSLVFSNNIGSQCGYDGFLFFGSSIADTTEATHMTYTGNKAIDPGNDCYEFGTAGSPGFVIVQADNNTCLRPRGSYGFFLGGNAGTYRGNTLSNNTVENATTGFAMGQTALAAKIIGNHCKSCTTAYNLNSPIDMLFIGNSDEGTTTTSIALGSADFSTFIGYSSNTNVVTGTFGTNSTVLGMRDGVAQLPSGLYGLNVGGNLTGVSTINPLLYASSTRCASIASPAVCAAAPDGSVVVAAGATTIQVNTTAVTANSQIILTRDDSLGALLAVTCNTQSSVTLGSPHVTGRVGGSNFTITLDVAPTTNPMCLSYSIVN